jgi:hypothetical protein
MQIDLERWAALLHQLTDTRYQLRASNLQLGEAQEKWMRLRQARDRAAADRSLNGSRSREITAVAESRLADAEAAFAAAEVEMTRVQANVAAISARFAAQSETIRQSAQWARARGIVLPDGDSASVRASAPPSSRGAANDFTAGMQLEAAAAPSGTAPAASAASAPAPGLIDRLRAAFASGP